MKKGVIGIVVVIAFLMAAFVGTLSWAQKTKSGDVPDVYKLEDSLFGKHKRPPVMFTHLKHSVDHKLKCEECHHVYKDGKNTFKEGDKVQKCHDCHKSPLKNEGKILSLQNAFHKNCKDCHNELQKSGNKKAPTKCAECHKK